MEIEEKIEHLKSLQASSKEAPNSHKKEKTHSTKEKLFDIISGTLLAIASIQYLVAAYFSFINESITSITSGSVALTVLLLIADKLAPIRDIEESKGWLAECFNFFLLRGLVEQLTMPLSFILILVSLSTYGWGYLFFIAYPILLIFLLSKRHNQS